jgi:hypothetical protein
MVGCKVRKVLTNALVTEPIKFGVGGFVQTALWKVRREPFGSRPFEDANSKREAPAL